MSRQLSQKERRLVALAVAGFFWGAFLVALGLAPVAVAFVAVVVLAAAAIASYGRPLVGIVRIRGGHGSPIDWTRARSATAVRARGGADVTASFGRRVATHGRALDAAALRAARTAADRMGRIDWAGHRAAAARQARAAGAATDAGRRRTQAAGLAAATAAVARARDARGALAERRERVPPPGPREARRLNEQAATFRQQGRHEEALELGEQALAIFRALGDRHGEALTLNGIGLAQARTGDETGALDSYEMAVALLTELGDDHGAGRVLANLGALHRGQGHDQQARTAWRGALERLEPGTPEHERTAGQLGAVE